MITLFILAMCIGYVGYDFTQWLKEDRRREIELSELIERYKKGSGANDPDFK